MSRYLWIASRDPFENCDAVRLYDLVQRQADDGHEVTVFLIQNGVLPARSGSRYAHRLSDLSRSGVTVLADDFSLRERAVKPLTEGITPANMDRLITLLMTKGTKTIWH